MRLFILLSFLVAGCASQTPVKTSSVDSIKNNPSSTMQPMDIEQDLARSIEVQKKVSDGAIGTGVYVKAIPITDAFIQAMADEAAAEEGQTHNWSADEIRSAANVEAAHSTRLFKDRGDCFALLVNYDKKNPYSNKFKDMSPNLAAKNWNLEAAQGAKKIPLHVEGDKSDEKNQVVSNFARESFRSKYYKDKYTACASSDSRYSGSLKMNEDFKLAGNAEFADDLKPFEMTWLAPKLDSRPPPYSR